METISRTPIDFPVERAVAGPRWPPRWPPLGDCVMRRGPAWHRHALWVAALAAAFLLPLGGIRVPHQRHGRETAVARRYASPPLRLRPLRLPFPRPSPPGIAAGRFPSRPQPAGLLVLAYLTFFRLAPGATRPRRR